MTVTGRIWVSVAVLGCAVWAQTPDPQAPPAPADAPAPQTSFHNFTYKGLQVSGMVDSYYSLNFNHPSTGLNDVRTFDVYANRYDLNMAKIGLEYAPAPIGFRLDVGGGKGFQAFHVFDPNRDPEFMHQMLQAYISVKPKSWKGIELDFGKFYTSAGAEVTEPQLNWNYSRSLLFALGPFYHFGVRGSAPVNKHLSVGAQFVDGWNTVVDNNSGKTMGFNATVAAGKVTWANSYYGGPEHTDTNAGWRHFYDTALTVTPNLKTAFYFNFDWGIDRSAFTGKTGQMFYGVAGAFRWAPTSRLAFSPRFEWYNDRDGWATGTPQKLKECTLTAEYKIFDGILTRLEYRRDMSDQPFFHRGVDDLVKSQPTLTIGLIAFFGPKQ